MFNISEYLDKDFNDEILTDKVTLRGQETELRYRLLDGIDTIDASAKTNLGEKTAYILGATVYDGESGRLIGHEKGKLFVNLYPDDAFNLAVKIFEESNKRLQLENETYEAEIKNSGGINISESTEDIASATV